MELKRSLGACRHRVELKAFKDRQKETNINSSKFCTSDKVFDEGSNKKWWIGISYKDFNVCMQTKSKRVRLEYSEFFLLILNLISLWSFMKQLMWTITVIEEHSATSELSSMISVLVFSECLGLLLGPGPNNEVILICFDLFDIFVCKCVPLLWHLPGKKLILYSRTIPETPKTYTL